MHPTWGAGHVARRSPALGVGATGFPLGNVPLGEKVNGAPWEPDARTQVFFLAAQGELVVVSPTHIISGRSCRSADGWGS